MNADQSRRKEKKKWKINEIEGRDMKASAAHSWMLSVNYSAHRILGPEISFFVIPLVD